VWFALHLVAVKLAEKKKKTELPVSSLCPASLLTERRNKDRNERKATVSPHNPKEDSEKREKAQEENKKRKKGK